MYGVNLLETLKYIFLCSKFLNQCFFGKPITLFFLSFFCIFFWKCKHKLMPFFKCTAISE